MALVEAWPARVLVVPGRTFGEALAMDPYDGKLDLAWWIWAALDGAVPFTNMGRATYIAHIVDPEPLPDIAAYVAAFRAIPLVAALLVDRTVEVQHELGQALGNMVRARRIVDSGTLDAWVPPGGGLLPDINGCMPNVTTPGDTAKALVAAAVGHHALAIQLDPSVADLLPMETFLVGSAFLSSSLEAQ